MLVYYHNRVTQELTWDFPFDDQLAYTWKRKLSTDNTEIFVETTTIQEVWHRAPQYLHSTPERPTPAPCPHEDDEHIDAGRTQLIHQSID